MGSRRAGMRTGQTGCGAGDQYLSAVRHRKLPAPATHARSTSCTAGARPASMKPVDNTRQHNPRSSREEIMNFTHRFWRYLVLPLSLAGMLSISSAAELNPAALIYKLPD